MRLISDISGRRKADHVLAPGETASLMTGWKIRNDSECPLHLWEGPSILDLSAYPKNALFTHIQPDYMKVRDDD